MLEKAAKESSMPLTTVEQISPARPDRRPPASSRRLLWFRAGLLPGLLWPLAAIPQRNHILPLLAFPSSFHFTAAIGFTVWWLALCAWRLQAAGRGLHNGHEIQRIPEWFGLLVLLNLPLAAGTWGAVQLLSLYLYPAANFLSTS